jgi:putative flavoprotein involved in K+ transport
MSRCLSELGVDHAVLERGRIAERWRATSWHSLRLLTPNWMTRLPGFRYSGPDPDGFMSTTELIALLEGYARHSKAPVLDHTTVIAVEASKGAFRITTDRGDWSATAVVIATGYCDVPAVPAMHHWLAPSIQQLTPNSYRQPEQLARGGVLIVGASATGVQLADEIHASGRPVTLAVGRHTRLPRRYRGRDILWWLDRLGILTASIESVHDVAVSRDKPSLQLVGRADDGLIDLPTLAARGVRLTGRLMSVDGHVARFEDDLIATTAAADVKLAEVRARIDQFISMTGIDSGEPDALTLSWPLAEGAPTEIDLEAAGIKTVIWATGYQRAYPWLRIPVLDEHGEIAHSAGVTPHRGLYVLGLNFQRRRNSSFIDGVGDDAAFIARHLVDTMKNVPVENVTVPINPVTAFSTRSSGHTRRGFDVVIAGARCAGAATALRLARAGARVLVIDRGMYGTDTLSTHALMRGAVLLLHRWGVLPKIVAAATPPIRSATFSYRTAETTLPIDSKYGVDALYAPRRALLDRVLVDAAIAAGAEFKYRTTVDSVVRNASGRVTGVMATTDKGPHRIDADVVVGADGLRSTIAARVGAGCTQHGQHASAILYSYWEGVSFSGYEWQYRNSLSLGAIPTNNNATCIFVAIPSSSFRAEIRDTASAAYDRLLRQVSTTVTARLEGGRQVEPVRGFPGVPGCMKRSAGPGWALIGDAGNFKDPITAHGITDALRDAELLSRAILRGTDAALLDYENTRDELSTRFFALTDSIASFAWTDAELEALHRSLSEEMSRETRAVAGLPDLTSMEHEVRDRYQLPASSV